VLFKKRVNDSNSGIAMRKIQLYAIANGIEYCLK